MRNDTFCTTTIVRKKRGNALPGMRRTYFRWRHFRSSMRNGQVLWILRKCDLSCPHILLPIIEWFSLSVLPLVTPFFQTFLGVMFFMLCFKNCEFWELLLVCTLANSFFMEGRVLLLIGSEPEEVHFCFFAFGRSSVSLLPLPFK
jgi:hypothetical protein